MTCQHLGESPQHQPSCSFSCEEGSALVGSAVVQCTAAGVWTAPAPVCKDESQAAGDVACPLRPARAGSTHETSPLTETLPPFCLPLSWRGIAGVQKACQALGKRS